MTFAEESSVLERPSVWSDWKRRYLQKRYWGSWILAAVLPFILLRLVFMFEIGFPFQSASSSSVSLSSVEHTLHGKSPAPAPDVKSKTSPDSPPFIRPDEDAWVTHDDWINHDHNPPGDKGKEEHQVIHNGNENSTEVMEPFSSTTGNGDNFGLPEDNEKEESELDASDMTLKDEERTEEFPTADEETTTAEKDVSEAKDRFVAGNAEQEKSEVEEKIQDEEEIQTDENRNVESQEQVDEAQSNAAAENYFEEEQKGEVDEQAKAEQNVPEHPKPSEDKMPVGEQPKSEVTKPFEEQHDPEKNVTDKKETPRHDSDRADEATPEGQCDLFEGEWQHDPEGPLYTNSTCFYIQEAQNCMSNGRHDTEYMYWRWKPRDCDLPRFDAKSFLDSFRGKAIGFIGDSIARNQMQSLLCLLSQVEIPVRTYVSADDQTVRWLFTGHQVTLAVVWSSYLLKESNEGVMGFDKGQSVLFLDELDTAWTSVMTDFDVIIFLTGQWYYKSSVYINQGEVVGCHYCPKLNLTEIGWYQAYGKGTRQVLEKVSKEFKGIAIMSTFPISHFENGTWDTGGNCQRELPLELLESRSFPGDHNAMRDIVVDEFQRVITENRDLGKDVRLEILDVTRVSLQRADGHPGPFRSPHPFEGRDPDVYYPNDCLHWCLPGPIEAWNQLVVKIVEKYL